MQQTLGRLLHGEDWVTRQIPKPVAKAGSWLQNDVLDEHTFVRDWMIDSADDHYEIDTARARHWLDWRPGHALRDALPSIVAKLKADPVGWYRSNKLDAARVATLAVKPAPPAPPPTNDDMAQHAAMMRSAERRGGKDRGRTV